MCENLQNVFWLDKNYCRKSNPKLQGLRGEQSNKIGSRNRHQTLLRLINNNDRDCKSGYCVCENLTKKCFLARRDSDLVN